LFKNRNEEFDFLFYVSAPKRPLFLEEKGLIIFSKKEIYFHLFRIPELNKKICH
jgi:hypothetical protein